MASENTEIRLHRIAPWDRSLRGRGNRYAQIGGRLFHAERVGGVWSIWEIDRSGLPLGLSGATYGADAAAVVAAAFGGHASNLPQVAAAIAMRLDGKGEDEIRDALLAMPAAGTGRNHPKNVARRRGWWTP